MDIKMDIVARPPLPRAPHYPLMGADEERVTQLIVNK